MVETHWGDIAGREVRYTDHTWELTGNVGVRNSGESLAVEAKQADDVRGETATLHFEVEDPADSLNPGNLGEHFDSLERTREGQYLVVKKDRRTYRYELRRLEYD
ncbi:hypothetical protein [Halorussus amylolyticus]|uniref:hypothetical protein n=1 Tax=Halorussus amylolyticus TaxID=1126242 RepID=UPI00104D731C|nr:hypothetical protein [Halorussus amylolyticus]